MINGWIKVCGVTCAEDIDLLVDCGAHAVGLNLWPKSPRSVSCEKLLELTEYARGRLEVVWVTVDMKLDELSHLATQGAPNWIQLHGEQPVAYAQQLPVKTFYAIGLQLAHHAERAETVPGDFVLVDARDERQKGGTGQLAPFDLAKRVCQTRPTILAGGLQPGNVAERIACVGPAGVDTASGVETSPGKKDPAQVRLFCERARAAFSAINPKGK